MQEQQQELRQATPAIHYLDTKLLAKNDTIHKLTNPTKDFKLWHS
jgi:hypothetical protein